MNLLNIRFICFILEDSNASKERVLQMAVDGEQGAVEENGYCKLGSRGSGLVIHALLALGASTVAYHTISIRVW